MTPSMFARQPLPIQTITATLIMAVIIMWADSKNPEWFTPVRTLSRAIMQPIYEVSLLPSYAGDWAHESLQSKESLRRENAQLKAQLLHTQGTLQQQDYIIAENARLQSILSLPVSEQLDFHLAKVIGTDSNPLKQILVLNKGAHDGIEVGQTVIDDKGVLGQVITVYPNSSRLMLLTNEQQSVAVMIKRTGQRAIVSGKGLPDSLSLNYVFKSSDVRVGDELISSGLGGRIPAGYKVGRVSRVNDTQADNFRSIDVSPTANFLDNAYVLILQSTAINTTVE